MSDYSPEQILSRSQITETGCLDEKKQIIGVIKWNCYKRLVTKENAFLFGSEDRIPKSVAMVRNKKKEVWSLGV